MSTDNSEWQRWAIVLLLIGLFTSIRINQKDRAEDASLWAAHMTVEREIEAGWSELAQRCEPLLKEKQ